MKKERERKRSSYKAQSGTLRLCQQQREGVQYHFCIAITSHTAV